MKLLYFLILFFIPCSLQATQEKIIDLTWPFNEQTIYWPTNKGFELTKVFWGYTEKGYFYSGNTFCAPEHGGTHLDAPIHFAKEKWTVEQIPITHLVGLASVIDLRKKIGENADYLISKEDILEWEKSNGSLGSRHIVLFNTGWSRFWGNKKKYLGSDEFGDVDHLHFPGLSEEAAHYLALKKVIGVGLDTPSLDYGQSKDFIAHRILLKENIYGLENVAHLDQLPPTGARLYVAPMKIEKGTGAPVRIYAVIE